MCMFPSVELNIDGPDGNAFVIIATITNCLEQAGWSKNEIKAVQADLTKSDYDHLCYVAKRFIKLKSEFDYTFNLY